MLIRNDYFRFDDRCFSHPGVIIDLGCRTWDWSFYFLDKNKRVIGFDCNEESQPVGAELRKQMVMPYGGECLTYGKNGAVSVMNIYDKTDGIKHKVVSLDSILSEFAVMPSILKMNIEGAEYPLLFSLKSPPSDQLIVSFHDFHGFPYPKQLSEIVRNYLSVWYDWTLIYPNYSWWIGILKEHFRTTKNKV